MCADNGAAGATAGSAAAAPPQYAVVDRIEGRTVVLVLDTGGPELALARSDLVQPSGGEAGGKITEGDCYAINTGSDRPVFTYDAVETRRRRSAVRAKLDRLRSRPS